MPVSTLQQSETGLPSDLESCHALIHELVLTVESQSTDIACLKERLQSLLRGKFGQEFRETDTRAAVAL